MDQARAPGLLRLDRLLGRRETGRWLANRSVPEPNTQEVCGSGRNGEKLRSAQHNSWLRLMNIAEGGGMQMGPVRSRLTVGLSLLLVAACSSSDGARLETSGDATGATAREEVELPLATAHEINPGAVDERGCQIVTPEKLGVDDEEPERVCPAGDGSGPIPEEVMSGPPESLELALVGAKGFLGSRFARAVPLSGSEKGVYVLEETVRIDQSGNGLVVIGLVRNETSGTLPAIELTADLQTSEGKSIAVVSGPALVGSVRAGEPVPFRLSSSEVTEDVDHIVWSAQSSEAKPANRDAVPAVLGAYPPGDRGGQQIITSDYDESRSKPPYPYVLHGTLAYYGDSTLRSVEVTLAWLDSESGQLLALVGSTAVEPGSTSKESSGFGSDGAADFFHIDESSVGEKLASAEVMVWVTAQA